jgi:predicted metal-dependent phosphoesterase TrpH
MSLQDIISACQMKGINCLAICDHGTAEGGLKLQEMAPFKVIVAEEVLTPCGEIMGMFLKETIPSHQPAEEVVQQIKAQGGLVCIPHPDDFLRPSSLLKKDVLRIAPFADVIEVLNARTVGPRSQGWLRALMKESGIAASAGSDAHTPGEIGTAYVEMPEFNGWEDFLQALRLGKIMGHRSSPLVHWSTTWERMRKKAFVTRGKT